MTQVIQSYRNWIWTTYWINPFREKSLRILLTIWVGGMLFWKFRFFYVILWVSVGQRAAKLRSIKLWGWSHGTWAVRVWCVSGEQQNFFKPPISTACNFAARDLDLDTDSISLKRSKPFKNIPLTHRIGFTLSNWSHLSRSPLTKLTQDKNWHFHPNFLESNFEHFRPATVRDDKNN